MAEVEETSLNAKVEAILENLQEVPSAPDFIRSLAGEMSVREKSLDRASRKQWNSIHKAGGNEKLEKEAGVVRENLRRYVVTHVDRAKRFLFKELGEPVPLKSTVGEVLSKHWVKLSDLVNWAEHQKISLPYVYGSFAALSKTENEWGLTKHGKTIFVDMEVFKKKFYQIHVKEGKITNPSPE